MRDRRMKILLNRFKVLIRPECLDQDLLQDAPILAGCYVTENISCPSRGPCIGGKLNGRIAENLDWTKHPYREIRDRGSRFYLGLDARRTHQAFGTEFLAKIHRQAVGDVF